jgi:hypothetical protein
MSESIQIYLNSNNLTSGTVSDGEYNLPVIEIPDGFHIYASVVNAMIPYSFYNMNSTNNLLYYSVGSNNYNITIPSGNYNVTQLISTLTSLMSNFTITYNYITNKLTWVNSIGDFTFLSTSTCLGVIGFSSTTSSASQTLTSINCINVNQIKCINIISNLITYNISQAFINNSSILCCIPVNSPPYSIIEYKNLNHYRCNLFINIIRSIKIKLLDDSGNIINLNGCGYNMTLQLDVIPFSS